MRYLHGSYLFDTAEVFIRSHTRVMQNSPRGRPAIFRETINCGGEVKGSQQTAIRTKIEVIKNAFAVSPVAQSGLLHTDGSPSSHYLTSANSATGVQSLLRPSFPDSRGSEYATHRRFNFAVTADYFSTIDDLYSFSESLTFRGTGGPRWAMLELDTGAADVQQVSTGTIQIIAQTGTAVGLTNYPAFPPPIFTDTAQTKLMNPESAYELIGPQNLGNRQAFFTTRWNYVFRSVVPRNGFPAGA